MKNFLIALVLAVAYFAFGKLSAYFGAVNSIININIFVPEGIALAAAILFGPRVVWGIFAGQMFFALSNHLGFIPSILIGLINTLEALMAIYFVKRWNIDITLPNLQSVLRFFFLVIFILQPFSAFFGNLTLTLFGISQIEEFWLYTISWYFGNVVAQLVITTMLLSVYNAIKNKKFNPLRAVLTIAFFSVLVYTLVAVMHLNNMALLLSITVIALFVVSYYLGVVCGAIAIQVIAAIMVLFTQHGMGIFTLQSTFDNIVNLNFYMLAHVFIFYIHQAMYREKEALLLKLKTTNENLGKTVQEEIEKNREIEKFLMYQSRFAQMGEIINMIAHQWRQPLNSLSIIVQTIAIKYKKGSLSQKDMDESQKTLLDQIDQMSETIDSFRNFFKPEKQMKEFNLQDVLSHILKISTLEIQRNDIKFTYYKNSEVKLYGYPNELGQALLNIINNAKDQLIDCSCEEKQIILNVEEQDKSVLIEISDTAGGIKESDLEKIFEPYFSTKGAKNGTGLGLYITKMIIEDHMHGKISVRNTQKGALFCIKLDKSEGNIDAD